MDSIPDVVAGTAAAPAISRTPQYPRIPNEILDEILNHLIADSGSCDDSLRSCSLVSKSWVPSCRRHLFHTIIFSSRNVAKWLKTFPVPQESPAHYVKDLRLSFGRRYGAPEKFSKHTTWFTNVEEMVLTMTATSSPPKTSFPARLPQSVTSLTIRVGNSGVDLMQMQDIMAGLPNLNGLILLYRHNQPGGHQSPQILPPPKLAGHRQNCRQPGGTSPVTVRTAVSLAARHQSPSELPSA